MMKCSEEGGCKVATGTAGLMKGGVAVQNESDQYLSVLGQEVGMMQVDAMRVDVSVAMVKERVR